MIELRRVAGAVLPFIAILALVIAIMAPGLKGGFLFDDNPNIVENEAVHITTLSFTALRDSIRGPTAGPLGRPVSVLSFALTHYAFGLDPFAFKAINLVIHALNGLLIAWFAALLLQILPNRLPARTWLPCWVAVAWLAHPINVVPVMLAVQRMTLLATMFLLLALIGHLKGIAAAPGSRGKWCWLAASWLILWPLSILSKETGLLFPLYVLTIAFFSRSDAGPSVHRAPWVITASVLSLLVIGVAMISYLGRDWLAAAYVQRPFSLSERLLTEARVLWFYAAQIILPRHASFGLYLDDFGLSSGLWTPATTLPALLGWTAIIAAITLGRRRYPITCFAAAWFLAGHALESTFLPLEIAHEYRNYLPSFGLLFGAAWIGTSFLGNIKLDHRSLTTGLVAALPLFMFALFTWMRADQLGDPIVGSQIEAAHHPQSARANLDAALTLIKAGYGDAKDPVGTQQVKYYLEKTLDVDPSFKFGEMTLIFWACASNRPVQKQWIEQFSIQLEHTPFAPRDLELPDRILAQLMLMPKCLERENALRLFVAGASNHRLDASLRAKFLESASDYELLIALDPKSTRDYLAQAAALSPGNGPLQRKLSGFGITK
jgi:protein O-mannosyl-transferase